MKHIKLYGGNTIKYYEDFDWSDKDFDFEEESDKILDFTSWKKDVPDVKLDIGDRLIVRYKNISLDATVIDQVVGWTKTPINIIEFDKYIDGHTGDGKGKPGHCWNYVKGNRGHIKWLIDKIQSLNENFDWSEEDFDYEEKK